MASDLNREVHGNSVAMETSTSATATATATPIEYAKTINSTESEDETHHAKLSGEIQHLLDSIDEAVDEFQNSLSTDSKPSSVDVGRMKDKFRSSLAFISQLDRNRFASISSSAYTDSECSFYSNSNSDVIHKKVILHLRRFAERMIAAGLSQECIGVYTSVRKTVVDEKFKKLGKFKRLSSKNVQRLEWQVQQEKIQHWIHAAKICISRLFADERKLTDQIFDGLGTCNISDYCFINSVKDSAIKVFNFVQSVSSGRKSPEKLFKILDIHIVLSDLLPEIENLFRSTPGEFIRKLAVETLSSLSKAARETITEFEKAVLGEISEAVIRTGSVHPMTKYVMNYITSMVKYKQTLIKLIVSKPSTHSTPSELESRFCEFDEGNASPLVLHYVWIIMILKFNLVGKSKQYKDASSAHLFMTNNVDYIVRRIKASVGLGEMIGYNYQNTLITLAEANYAKTTWKRLLDCFRCGGLPEVGSPSLV